jgi:hypothetical protein
VGTPPYRGGEKWKHFKVLFHGFKDLSVDNGRHITSTRFSCNGHEWAMGFYPGVSCDWVCRSFFFIAPKAASQLNMNVHSLAMMER